MQTVELVDELIERFKGWSTDGPHGVLRYLDQAQAILMAQESLQNIAYDEETGELPVLQTEAGKRVYEMPDYPGGKACEHCDYKGSIWRVTGVMLREDTGGFPGAEARVTNEAFWTVKLLRTRDWLSHDRPATVTFAADPQGRAFYLRAYRRPPSLTSTRMEHIVPPPNDILYLLPAAGQLIEGVQNGNLFEQRLYIERELKPKFWAQMNKGQQSESLEPVDRGF